MTAQLDDEALMEGALQAGDTYLYQQSTNESISAVSQWKGLLFGIYEPHAVFKSLKIYNEGRGLFVSAF